MPVSNPGLWRWLRLGGGAAVLAALGWRLGADPFLAGLREVDLAIVAWALGLGVATTAACAWRWCSVARSLGVGLQLRAAVADYYGSQFLNTVLPGGVLGDVHRGVRHGREVGDPARGLRAVAWERLAGQVVLVVLTLSAVVLLPSPVRPSPPVAVGLLGVLLLGVLGARTLRGREDSWRARVCRAVRADVHDGLWSREQLPGVVGASALAVAGYAVTFLVAARTVGVTAPVAQVVPIALLVLLAMSVPANVAGWGPREGAAAWAFGAAGLGAADGVATAVVYGVMVLVASLPGAVLLLMGRRPPAAPRVAGAVSLRPGRSRA